MFSLEHIQLPRRIRRATLRARTGDCSAAVEITKRRVSMPFITVGKENSGSIDLYYEDHGSG